MYLIDIMEIYNKVKELAKKSTPKFTETEKILLLSIIEDVKEIVESRKTDGPSIERKKATWELITEQYANSALNRGFSVRTEAQLKRCWINLKYRCRQSDSASKLDQLKTGGGPPIVIDDDEEDIHERVRRIVPTIDFTLKNEWDSTSEIENMQDIFEEEEEEEEEIGNKADFDKYESSNENDHASCYLAADLSASAGFSKKVSKKVLFNKCLTKNNAGSTITKISESIDSSLSRHSSKSSAAGLLATQRKRLNALQNILSKNDEGLENRLNKCKDLSEEPSNKKRKFPTGSEIEQDFRIQKLGEVAKQQSELHTEKLTIIRKECEYWDKMKAAANLKIQAMQAQLRYWRAKYSAIESDI